MTLLCAHALPETPVAHELMIISIEAITSHVNASSQFCCKAVQARWYM